MSSLQAAITVALGLVVIAGPMLWWVFYRDGYDGAASAKLTEDPVLRMSVQEISRVEAELQLTLPAAYADFLRTRGDYPDNTTVLDTADLIIGCTTEYRHGIYGAPPWPWHLVCIGDEADACPYALDCLSGEIVQTHKGNTTARPIARFADFTAFLEAKGAGVAA